MTDDPSIVSLSETVEEHVRQYTDAGTVRPWWRKPLAASARADGRFGILKEAVAPDHLLPEDLLPGAISVVVYFLPFRRELPASNIKGRSASRDWAEAYLDTNRLIAAINDRLSDLLAESGYRTAVTPATHNFKPERLVSGWSHKHVAHLCGLGRMGVHTQIITPAGCCGRLGSLVTDADLGDHTVVGGEELCRHKTGGECLACVKKCPVGALTEDGFDRFACYDRLMKNDALFPDLPLTDVCGKCVSIVPCSFKSPVGRDA